MNDPAGGVRTRVATLDALRGVAILGVIAVHASGIVSEPIGLWGLDLRKLLIWSGRYGVELFFVLSGLTITWSYRTQGNRYDRPLIAYFFRRFFRLSPMYYLTLVVLAIVGYNNILEPTTINPPADMKNLALHFSYAHGLFPNYVRSILGPAWSLTPEVIFYLTLPFILLVCPTPWIRFGFFLLMVGVSEWYARHWDVLMEPSPTNYIWSTIAPPRLFFLFAGGIMLADVFIWRNRGLPPGPERVWTRWANAIFLASVARFYSLYYNDANPLWTWLTIVTGVLAYCLHSSWLHLLLAWGPLQRLGVVSYSMFLVHFPLIDWLRPQFASWFEGRPPAVSYAVFFVAILGVSWLIASQTYGWIERPGMALGDFLVRRSDRRNRVAAATGGPPATG